MFKELLILARALNLVYHQMHNVAKSCSFFADHAELAAMYTALDADYDSLAERRIGLGQGLSSSEAADIVREAAEILANLPEGEMVDAFTFAMQLESEYVRELKLAEANMSAGTVNMLQGLADLSEVRQYKIARRVM